MKCVKKIDIFYYQCKLFNMFGSIDATFIKVIRLLNENKLGQNI